MDKPRAITTCAHKLARLIYTLLTKGEEYVDQGQAQYEERYRQRVIRTLTKKAEQLGFQLITTPEAAKQMPDKSMSWNVFLESELEATLAEAQRT